MKERENLYERLGGEQAVTDMVGEFYDRVLADLKLRPFFEHVEMDKLRRMQREFFSAALGGPLSYTGVPLGYAHYGRGISRGHFARFVGVLLDTLKARGVEETDAGEIIARINTYADEIIGTQSVSE